MSDSKENEYRTPSDVLISAMEEVETYEDIMIIVKLKRDSDNKSGIAYRSNIPDLPGKFSLIEEYKILAVAFSYGLTE